ncbi:MAG: replication-associated recombination protein A [Proteocatella sp.]
MEIPFYQQVRPEKLEDMIGQRHILKKGMMISKLYEQKRITSMIFYGPPGTGKTTLANILIENADLKTFKLNATYSKTQDIRDITSQLDGLNDKNSIVVFVDEIQNFNKKQQQLLLEYIELGNIILIANTTENPYHHVYKSLLSRCSLIEFKSLEIADLRQGLKNCIEKFDEIEILYTEEDIDAIIGVSNGDFRKALNILGILIEFYTEENKLLINKENIKNVSSSKVIEYDRNSDSHYDLLSAFQKSIRGSDSDAAVHYLARLVYAEDLDSICRRLMVIACEDIGLAYPQAITIVKACVDSAYMLGFPEARIPLAQATLLLAISPKSNSAYMALAEAMNDLENMNINEIPKHLKDSHYSGAKQMGIGVDYKYPHSYKNSYVEQSYLPEVIKNRKYYMAKENKFEKSAAEYLEKIKK